VEHALPGSDPGGPAPPRHARALPEDAARLSPIGSEHLNVCGKYSFTLAESIRAGAFHPLREPDDADETDANEDETAEAGTPLASANASVAVAMQTFQPHLET
jgi:hypothetical protein